ncbi:sigma-54 interaction domain-containing protein [Sinanaerobacter sp. ZZT-01]|uniref:sigma-54 interaction domain-containing protein n=1 Tax=Sinanaerobacter sp. ZZT-01 TaxID=3111540 RepID=UPI002D78D670|nr:sigma 54-interacting transcriptional regulator [Sinanaerobacter sp. ZZT-01]WRR93264.1 sigma 54-interacting transcriptional regulator [Sinanaerobacter sp. ZZT-01]
MSDKNLARYKYIFDEILRMTDDGFIVVDQKGIVTDINDQYCHFLGKKKEDIIGYNIKKNISNSKMLDIIQKNYSEELALHKFENGETKESDDSFLLVSRSCVYDEAHDIVAGVAQVKFRLQTLDSAKRLMNEYAELEFYKEAYQQNTSQKKYCFQNIIGSNIEFVEKKKAATKAAKTDFSILLTGETGTGKEVFAQAIHNASHRANKPMVSINCAAIPANLLESELFGYEEGAFTGAKKGGKKGKFLMANSGTVFLDEIGDMPLNMQAKILRVLQEKEIEPVGGLGPIPVDVRVISATRKNLNEMIENGEFREDLYYRINVINIDMLPLRTRKTDILELANYFLKELNKEYNKTIALSKDVKRCFTGYAWPGNIRELDNVIKAAYAICDGFFIALCDLPSKMVSRHKIEECISVNKKLPDLVGEYEKDIIIDTLKKNGGNCELCSSELGIHISALYKKIKKYNIRYKSSKLTIE